jgi:hypothetical protein
VGIESEVKTSLDETEKIKLSHQGATMWLARNCDKTYLGDHVANKKINDKKCAGDHMVLKKGD